MAIDSTEVQAEELLDTSDFTLDEQETEKGGEAIRAYLGSIKSADAQHAAEDNLHVLAVLISGGTCDARDFPWHQLRSYHSAAALSILREEDIPAQIETWRCKLNDARKFHQVPKSYAGAQVQKIAASLHKVLRECHQLGFITSEERDRAISPSKVQSAPVSKNRLLTDGEFRALASTCNMDESPAGPRDALIFYLGFQGGLRVGEIVGVALKDLHFDSRRSAVTVRVRESGKSRARIIALENDALIALEDWMELRDASDGPLLCPLRRSGKLEVRRLTAAQVAEICDTRARQAGVAPFIPQELRRSWEVRGRAKRRKSGLEPEEEPKTSPLFANGDEESGPAEKIHFPYLGRSQTLG